MSSISKRAIAYRQAARSRPELREPSSPRQTANPSGTFALKVQYAPEVEAALRRYAQEQLIKDARFARALVQEGIELVEEGLERAGARASGARS